MKEGEVKKINEGQINLTKEGDGRKRGKEDLTEKIEKGGENGR